MTDFSASPADVEVVTRLLGKRPGGQFRVVCRRPDGSPVVIENLPHLDDGTPMPTLFWLIDPAIREAVSRVESNGGVHRFEPLIDPADLEAAHAAYAKRRNELVTRHDLPQPSGGVGGTRTGLKCLHAHVAASLAGMDDPAGELVLSEIDLGDLVRPEVAASPEPSERLGTMTTETIAAIDCGTNSTRLLIETRSGEVLVREMRITRMGQGVDATGSLAPEAIERTLGVLADYRALMDQAGVTSGRLAATSAARDADNGPEFLAVATATTGLTTEILSGVEEAELSYAGAMVGLESARGDDLVLDIGGGSSEIVLVRNGEVKAHSMQVGCVRVSERTLLSDPPTQTELADARAMAEAALDEAFELIPELSSIRPDSRLVGLAGTVATLAMVEQGLTEYDRSKVHHLWLSLDTIRTWCDTLAAEPASARFARAGMVEGRQDVIVGGLIVLVATLERLGLEGCLTSESDILDGLVASQRLDTWQAS